MRVRRHIAILTGLFVGCRLILTLGGLKFRTTALGNVHLLDLADLRDNPFGAFTSLHMQPPLFNFFVGAVLRWSPFPPAASFQLIYWGLGLATVLMLWMLLSDLGTRRWVATIAAGVVAVDPLLIRNESVLSYETPIAAILVALCLASARYLKRGDLRRLVPVLALLVIGVLMRAALNPLWLILAIALLLLLRPPKGSRRVIAASIVVALILVGLPMLQNATRFDSPGLSSYAGMNLQRITALQLPQHRLKQLIANGALSPAVAVTPFSSYAKYERYFGSCHPVTTNPFLGPVVKPHGGGANFNSYCFLPVYRQALRDSLKAARTNPGVYARSVVAASLIYVSWDGSTAKPTSSLWNDWNGMYGSFMLPVSIKYPLERRDPQPYAALMQLFLALEKVSVTMTVALLYVLASGARATWVVLRGRADASARTRVFIGFVVLSISVASVTLDIYENARFREPLDPLLLGLFVAALVQAVVAACERRRHHPDRHHRPEAETATT